MKDEYIVIIVFIIAFVIFVYVIGGMMPMQ